MPANVIGNLGHICIIIKCGANLVLDEKKRRQLVAEEEEPPTVSHTIIKNIPSKLIKMLICGY